MLFAPWEGKSRDTSKSSQLLVPYTFNYEFLEKWKNWIVVYSCFWTVLENSCAFGE